MNVLFQVLFREFPDDSMVKTLPSNVGDASSIPGQETKIPHATWPKKKKQKQYCNKFNKDFKNSPQQQQKL